MRPSLFVIRSQFKVSVPRGTRYNRGITIKLFRMTMITLNFLKNY